MRSDGCAVCGDPAEPGFECSYCGEIHCTAHRLPESHSCPGEPQSPTAARHSTESDANSDTQQSATFNREDPSKRMERVTTASSASTTIDENGDDGIPDPRKPTFEASSPDLNPDGSLAADDEIDKESNQPDISNRLSTARRLYYKLRATVRAPFGLLREYVMPLLVVIIIFAVVVGLLIST